MSDLFARVRPLVGEALESCQVAVMGSPAAAVLVELLVACGVRHWVVIAGNGWMDELVAGLRQRYGSELDINLERIDSIGDVGAADLALVVDDAEIACQLPVTLLRLAIFTPTDSQPCRAIVALAGECFALPERYGTGAIPYESARSDVEFSGDWDWRTAAPMMALAARALLLRGTAFAMATWADAWAKGLRAYAVGDAYDPTRASWQASFDVDSVQPLYRTPRLRQATLLIAGLGSLGSVAAEQLAPWVERLVLVDPDHVEVVNLVRQAYSQCQVGEAKAVALAKTLGAAHPGLVCESVVTSLIDEEQVADLIRRYGVTAALVTTGTHADFAITRALRGAAIPHVAGRCYARARFWEGIVVDGASGASYEQVRRGVEAGPLPAPTPEEIAAYGAVGELIGEPATAMETGWAAMWLARLMAQMMMPATLREGWLLARLAAGATCFIGGLVVEQGMGGAAYGVSVPGEVHAWSIGEIG